MERSLKVVNVNGENKFVFNGLERDIVAGLGFTNIKKFTDIKTNVNSSFNNIMVKLDLQLKDDIKSLDKKGNLAKDLDRLSYEFNKFVVKIRQDIDYIYYWNIPTVDRTEFKYYDLIVKLYNDLFKGLASEFICIDRYTYLYERIMQQISGCIPQREAGEENLVNYWIELLNSTNDAHDLEMTLNAVRAVMEAKGIISDRLFEGLQPDRTTDDHIKKIEHYYGIASLEYDFMENQMFNILHVSIAEYIKENQ